MSRLLRAAIALLIASSSLSAHSSPARFESVTLVILVDVTASLHRAVGGVAGLPSSALHTPGTGYRDPIPPAVESFRLLGLQPDDRVRFGAIARRLVIGDRFITDEAGRAKAWNALFDLPPIDWLGPSPIWDAVADAVGLLATESGRRAIVLVTDGQASGNRLGSREAAAVAKNAGIPVHVIAEEAVFSQEPIRPMSALGIDPAKALRALAEATGGTFVLDRAVRDESGLGLYFKRDTENVLRALLETLHR